MHARDVVLSALGSTQFLLTKYLDDLSDADLLVRPVTGANHIAWQLGHVINSEPFLVKSQLPDAVFPEFPAGFAEAHDMGRASHDGPDGFLSRAEYVDLFNRVRSATLDAVGKLSDSDLDRPSTGRMAPMAPTLCAMLLLVSNHTMMHGGQFSVLRRKLGKPILF